jgi:hypothetical protein
MDPRRHVAARHRSKSMKGRDLMFTSNYASLAKIKSPLRPVSISRGKPRWMKGGWLAHVQPGTVGRNFDELAPSAASLKADTGDYHRAFAAQLASLDPARVYADLGENAVLLCFCEVGRLCHRRIVAEWLEATMNVLIPELGEASHTNTELWTTEAYAHYMTLKEKMAWYEAIPGKAPEVKRFGPRSHRQTFNLKTGKWEATP